MSSLPCLSSPLLSSPLLSSPLLSSPQMWPRLQWSSLWTGLADLPGLPVGGFLQPTPLLLPQLLLTSRGWGQLWLRGAGQRQGAGLQQGQPETLGHRSAWQFPGQVKKLPIQNRIVNVKTKKKLVFQTSGILLVQTLTRTPAQTQADWDSADFADSRLLCKNGVSCLHQASLLLIYTANVPASQPSTLLLCQSLFPSHFVLLCREMDCDHGEDCRWGERWKEGDENVREKDREGAMKLDMASVLDWLCLLRLSVCHLMAIFNASFLADWVNSCLREETAALLKTQLSQGRRELGGDWQPETDDGSLNKYYISADDSNCPPE